MRRNADAFDRVELMPTAFGQVAAPDTTATLLGRPAAAPIVLAPTGYTRLSHHTGERAAAAAAEQAGLPYTLSTYATTSITDVARAAPGGRNWFQVYLMKDRAVTRAHLDEARAQGYEALVLTIDTTVTGMKRKDKQNGFAIPPQLTRGRWPAWPATPAGSPTSSPPSRCASRRSPRGPRTPGGACPTSCASRRSGPPTSPGCARSGAARSSSRASSRSSTPSPRSMRVRTRSCCPTTAVASSTAPRCRSSCCPPSSRRSPVVRRCTSTQASAAAVTWSPQSRSAPPA